uniref:SFRICE_007947 n=1 Tax=Spodoptera frugiperda TaxID=7108 RepID=A0A2H1VH14_SPOFR
MAEWDANNKTFLITGGASGLGALYAEAFLKEGAKNVAILDIAENLGKAKAESLNKTYGNKVIFVKCDVSKEEDIVSAWDSVLAQFKQIDVIVNNAGIMVDAPNVWRTASDVNWQGLVSFTLKGISHMKKDEGGAGGTIMNIASTVAFMKLGAFPIYSGSKMAVLHFSQCIAMPPFFEITGVRVVTLCLGPTDTALLENLGPKAYDPRVGQLMIDVIESQKHKVVYQKPESAVKVLVEMYKTGPPASIWLSLDNKPGQNITLTIDRAFKDFENLLKT